MQTFSLKAHPDHPPRSGGAIDVQIIQEGKALSLIYSVEAPAERMRLPIPAKPYRADGLWKTTCFELFVRDEGEGYLELNFSPSSQWAAYRFASYRDGMQPLEVGETALLLYPPKIWVEHGEYIVGYHLGVTLDTYPVGAEIGISAVIEETDGTKSYWALAHPPGAPDFHHPACFAATLPPPAQS